MQLIVPMSGHGSRFKEAGYTAPKPLITVEGKPIIAHVLDMFPGVDDVIFICNEDHLNSTDMQSVLETLRPNSTIVPITSHKKGPVYAVAQAFDYISPDIPVMVSYCDFTQRWDFPSFVASTKINNIAGAVPAYTGFHPHLLRKNLYAGIRVDDAGYMQEIKEKHCFTPSPEDSHHSSGAYYFGSGELLTHYFKEFLDSGETLNGEYYISMVYPLMLRDKHMISVPSITHFMQWGTPDDLEEYEVWSRQIHADHQKEKASTDIPKEREPLLHIHMSNYTENHEAIYQYWKQCLLT